MSKHMFAMCVGLLAAMGCSCSDREAGSHAGNPNSSRTPATSSPVAPSSKASRDSGNGSLWDNTLRPSANAPTIDGEALALLQQLKDTPADPTRPAHVEEKSERVAPDGRRNFYVKVYFWFPGASVPSYYWIRVSELIYKEASVSGTLELHLKCVEYGHRFTVGKINDERIRSAGGSS